jgi:hypothetical protein
MSEVLLRCTICGAAIVLDEGETIRIDLNNLRIGKTASTITGNCRAAIPKGPRAGRCNAVNRFDLVQIRRPGGEHLAE